MDAKIQKKRKIYWPILRAPLHLEFVMLNWPTHARCVAISPGKGGDDQWTKKCSLNINRGTISFSFIFNDLIGVRQQCVAIILAKNWKMWR
jgi:hypothetical protein